MTPGLGPEHLDGGITSAEVGKAAEASCSGGALGGGVNDLSV